MASGTAGLTDFEVGGRFQPHAIHADTTYIYIVEHRENPNPKKV